MKRYHWIERAAVWTFVLGWPAVSYGWGRVGHDAVAYIAECDLTPKTGRIVEGYPGRSIVYYALWTDDCRKAPGYEHTTFWHMAPVDARMRYTEQVRSPRGNAVCELENAAMSIIPGSICGMTSRSTAVRAATTAYGTRD